MGPIRRRKRTNFVERKAKQIFFDPTFMFSFCLMRLPRTWWNTNHCMDHRVHFKKLDEYSDEYMSLASNFFFDMDPYMYGIDNIQRIENPLLFSAFQLKFLQLQMRNADVRCQVMYHATRPECVYGIAANNFDWRFYGHSRGHKYGKGVSFSPSAKFASNFHNSNGRLKVMIVAEVVVGNYHKGYKELDVPRPGFDYAIDFFGNVVVKFDDNEFYPSYVISYFQNYFH